MLGVELFSLLSHRLAVRFALPESRLLVQSNFLGLGGTKPKEDELPPKMALDLGYHCILDHLTSLH